MCAWFVGGLGWLVGWFVGLLWSLLDERVGGEGTRHVLRWARVHLSFFACVLAGQTFKPHTPPPPKSTTHITIPQAPSSRSRCVAHRLEFWVPCAQSDKQRGRVSAPPTPPTVSAAGGSSSGSSRALQCPGNSEAAHGADATAPNTHTGVGCLCVCACIWGGGGLCVFGWVWGQGLRGLHCQRVMKACTLCLELSAN